MTIPPGVLPDLTPEGSALVGPARVAITLSQSTIHDPATALRLGFRGAIAAGSAHLGIFTPPALYAFGEQALTTGCLSLYFLNTVVSGERVQAVLELPHPGAKQVAVHARRADASEIRVCAGTFSVGDRSASELRTRDLRLSDPRTLRLFRDLVPGSLLADAEAVVPLERQIANLNSGLDNEPLPWYSGTSPWGGPIAAPFDLFQNAYEAVAPSLEPYHRGTSGMYGAIEIGYLNGPAFVDRPYRVRATAVGVGESPKTEYLWWDLAIAEPDGREIAAIRHLLRFLKGDSPLYPELTGDAGR